jgi:hypothetical protein
MEPLRHTKIEENGLFQRGTSHEEFVSHFYQTRYKRIEGELMRTPELLRTVAKKTIDEFNDRNLYELVVFEEQGKDVLAWSMNWYKLRNSDNEPYNLPEEDEEKIMEDFLELRKRTPLTAEIFIFQADGSDMLLIAVSLIL